MKKRKTTKNGATTFTSSAASSDLVKTDDDLPRENKWGTKFKDVDKLMAWLCYDQKVRNQTTGEDKVYTVCYEDRFLGLLETEVWRFHEEMEVPSHRVRIL
eukprot:CAMPEP_0170487770 /NCGR_PEP_ID=MMETSP0208-20121228/6505_1 /TAXON_ID=197538 /ORGANISM="Strombidium inclinatum, Strain S3" /LENGTH=100 /DNA_ID=CAMNT_0010762157 /DNA_START=2355 /DNA_END=2653 /DNA_ORIENTATION=-